MRQAQRLCIGSACSLLCFPLLSLWRPHESCIFKISVHLLDVGHPLPPTRSSIASRVPYLSSRTSCIFNISVHVLDLGHAACPAPNTNTHQQFPPPCLLSDLILDHSLLQFDSLPLSLPPISCPALHHSPPNVLNHSPPRPPLHTNTNTTKFRNSYPFFHPQHPTHRPPSLSQGAVAGLHLLQLAMALVWVYRHSALKHTL